MFFLPAKRTGGSPLRYDLTKKDQKIKAQLKFSVLPVKS